MRHAFSLFVFSLMFLQAVFCSANSKIIPFHGVTYDSFLSYVSAYSDNKGLSLTERDQCESYPERDGTSRTVCGFVFSGSSPIPGDMGQFRIGVSKNSAGEVYDIYGITSVEPNNIGQHSVWDTKSFAMLPIILKSLGIDKFGFSSIMERFSSDLGRIVSARADKFALVYFLKPPNSSDFVLLDIKLEMVGSQLVMESTLRMKNFNETPWLVVDPKSVKFFSELQ